MCLAVPGWNHPGRHLDDLPRGQRQLLPAPEPAHSQPGRREDCLKASERAGEILSAHRVPCSPSPTHSHKRAHSNQVKIWKFWSSRNVTLKISASCWKARRTWSAVFSLSSPSSPYSSQTTSSKMFSEKSVSFIETFSFYFWPQRVFASYSFCHLRPPDKRRFRSSVWKAADFTCLQKSLQSLSRFEPSKARNSPCKPDQMVHTIVILRSKLARLIIFNHWT